MFLKRCTKSSIFLKKNKSVTLIHYSIIKSFDFMTNNAKGIEYAPVTWVYLVG